MLQTAVQVGRAGRWSGRRLSLVPLPTARRASSSRTLRRHTQTSQQTKPREPFSVRSPHRPPASTATVDATENTLETAEAIFKARKIPLLACGVVALGLGLYLSVLASSSFSASCPTPPPAPDAVPTGRPTVFTKDSARKFDQSLDGSERLIGITSLRQKLAAEASGHVLEVAMGTGRNLSFYDWSRVLQPQSTSPTSGASTVEAETGEAAAAPILSFTGVDISGEMLGVAVEKLSEAVPALNGVEPRVDSHTSQVQKSWGVFSYLSDRLRFFRSDIHDFIPPPAQPASASQYDTVVQTFGLCSVRDPEQVIRNLAGMVKPETGRIILMEHGRGWWGVVNGLLDRSAASHFQKYGCWWNRDIADIVEKAANSTPGLEVVKIDRPYLTQLGTTLWVELRVRRQG